jgi:hypothetical protein
MVPRTILAVGKMPLLATGKLDYVTIRALVEARLLSPAAD